MSHADALARRMHEFQVNAGAPRPVARTDGVCVPAVAPIIGGNVADIGQASAKAVLRCNTAHRDVDGLAREKRLCAVGNTFEKARSSSLPTCRFRSASQSERMATSPMAPVVRAFEARKAKLLAEKVRIAWGLSFACRLRLRTEGV